MPEALTPDQSRQRFVHHGDLDEAALASLTNAVSEQARAASVRMATWLVVSNGAALTLCYQAMLARGDDAPALLSTVAFFFVVGLVCAFLSFIQFQTSLILTATMLETMHFKRIAERLGLAPPAPIEEKDWKRLGNSQSGFNGLLMCSALCFLIGAAAPVFGVLEADFLTLFD